MKKTPEQIPIVEVAGVEDKLLAFKHDGEFMLIIWGSRDKPETIVKLSIDVWLKVCRMFAIF